MIAYDLQCGNGHRFEGWFEDSAAFDRQNEQALISCPVCEDTRVTKLPSTFSIKNTPPAVIPENGEKVDVEALGKQIVDYVDRHFDNVGADFAQEALKMHYGVSEPRNIRGVSTPREEETLKAEGIHFFKFPLPAKPSDSDPT